MEKGKMRKMLLTLVVIGLVLGQVTAAYAAFIVPRLEVSIHNTNLEAGRKNNVIIKASNSGSLSLTEVEIILTSVSPLIFIVEGNHKVLNEILKESSQNYTAVVYVHQNAPSGAYTIQAQVKYVRYDETISLTVPLSVIVEKTFQPIFRLSVNPASQTLRNGYEGDVNYSLENTGKIELHNINIALTSRSPLVIINSDQNLEFSKICSMKSSILVLKLGLSAQRLLDHIVL